MKMTVQGIVPQAPETVGAVLTKIISATASAGSQSRRCPPFCHDVVDRSCHDVPVTSMWRDIHAKNPERFHGADRASG